jgi:hypothetical protein
LPEQGGVVLKKLTFMVAVLALLTLVAVPVIAQVGFEIGDAENESGEIETENNFSIKGNNNNACLGQLQFGNTGNFTNQQGVLQYGSEADDIEFEGPEIEFAPENETKCDQKVQQAAAASSSWDKW